MSIEKHYYIYQLLIYILLFYNIVNYNILLKAISKNKIKNIKILVQDSNPLQKKSEYIDFIKKFKKLRLF